MKNAYEISFEHTSGIYCSNIVMADSVDQVRAHYEKKYPGHWMSIRPAEPWELQAATERGKPVVNL